MNTETHTEICARITRSSAAAGRPVDIGRGITSRYFLTGLVRVWRNGRRVTRLTRYEAKCLEYAIGDDLDERGEEGRLPYALANSVAALAP